MSRERTNTQTRKRTHTREKGNHTREEEKNGKGDSRAHTKAGLSFSLSHSAKSPPKFLVGGEGGVGGTGAHTRVHTGALRPRNHAAPCKLLF